MWRRFLRVWCILARQPTQLQFAVNDGQLQETLKQKSFFYLQRKMSIVHCQLSIKVKKEGVDTYSEYVNPRPLKDES